MYASLAAVQELAGEPGAVSSVEVSALTTPDNELSRKAAQNPKSLSIQEWETWYCTAYVSAICYQIEEVIPGAVAKPIRQVAESEGAILEKTQFLMLLITLLSLIGSALGISNLVTVSVMERSREIGLLKAVGAHNSPITRLVLTEILFTAAIGGIVGYFAGLGFAQIIGHTVFGSGIEMRLMTIPLVAVLVFLVTLAGSIPSIRMLLALRPAEVLHGR
jgi:putative ABC transport system permease protein